MHEIFADAASLSEAVWRGCIKSCKQSVDMTTLVLSMSRVCMQTAHAKGGASTFTRCPDAMRKAPSKCAHYRALRLDLLAQSHHRALRLNHFGAIDALSFGAVKEATSMRPYCAVLIASCALSLFGCGEDEPAQPSRQRLSTRATAAPDSAPEHPSAAPNLAPADNRALAAACNDDMDQSCLSLAEGKARYIAEMRRDGVWGGAMELQALANVMQASIAVYMPDGSALRQQALLTPSTGDTQLQRATFCLHLAGGHYGPMGLWQPDEALPDTFWPDDHVVVGQVPGDGNCLFAAVGALVGHPADFLRHVACDVLERDFSDAQLAEEYEDMLAWRAGAEAKL